MHTHFILCHVTRVKLVFVVNSSRLHLFYTILLVTLILVPGNILLTVVTLVLSIAAKHR